MNLFIQFSPHWTFKRKTEKGDNKQSVQPPSPWQGPSYNETENGTYMQPSTSRKLKPKMRRFSAWFSGRLRKSKGLFYESRCMRQDVRVHWQVMSILFGRKYCILIKTLLSWLRYDLCSMHVVWKTNLGISSEKCKCAYSERVSSGSNASWVRFEVSVKQWRTIHYKTSGRGRLLALVVC